MKNANQILGLSVIIAGLFLATDTYAACTTEINELGQQVETCYDSNNNQTSQTVSEFYENGTKKKETYESSTVSYTYEYHENGKMKAADRTEYDSDGNKTKHVTNSYNEKQYVLDHDLKTYNQDGSIKNSEVWHHEYYDDGVTVKRATVERPDYHNIQEFYSDGSWKRYYNEYYDSNGKKTHEGDQVYYENGVEKLISGISYFEDGRVKQKDVYTKDEQGNKLHEEKLEYDTDGTFKEAYEMNTFPDSYGNMTTKREDYNEDGKVIKTTENLNFYDEEGNQIGGSYIETDADGVELYKSIMYEYDDVENGAYYLFETYENGFITYRESYINEDGENTYDTAEYFENGLITQKDFYYYGDDEHNVTHYFTYDENGNLISERVETEGYNQDDEWDTLSIKTKTFNRDGSYALYDKDGNLLGYKGKRIYTIDEANQVAGKTNHVSIRYR